MGFVWGYTAPPRAGGGGGGPTTELMARPVIATLFPHLSAVVQPLSGEFGGRRSLLEQLPFVRGYGVDIGLLIDVADTVGVAGMAQVDLGTRIHRNRDLDDLGPQSLVVLQTALDRAGVRSANPATLVRPGHPPLVRGFGELPPIVSLPELTVDAVAPPAEAPGPNGRRSRLRWAARPVAWRG
jgi:glucosyl-3-phosphoglycerate synthase